VPNLTARRARIAVQPVNPCKNGWRSSLSANSDGYSFFLWLSKLSNLLFFNIATCRLIKERQFNHPLEDMVKAKG